MAFGDTTDGDRAAVPIGVRNESDFFWAKGEEAGPANPEAFSQVKDSGKRQEFSTGSVRDTRDGKGRFDLISTIALRRLAAHYENGSRKYGDRNWEKGQPLGRYLDSAMRHLISLLECKHDEDHAAAVAWNAFAFMHTAEKIRDGSLPKELDDIGFLGDTNAS